MKRLGVFVLSKNTTKCPRPGLKPGPLDPEASALTRRPLRLQNWIMSTNKPCARVQVIRGGSLTIANPLDSLARGSCGHTKSNRPISTHNCFRKYWPGSATYTKRSRLQTAHSTWYGGASYCGAWLAFDVVILLKETKPS